jgi:hypothetical protein
MADIRNPDDPYRSTRSPNDPIRTDPADDDFRRSARLDNELQVDPELAEGRAGGGRIAMFAVAVALILGAVFYGLNNTSINGAGTSSSTAQNTAQPSPPPAPPGMRDVTPHANTDPGVTTGAASPPTTPTASPPGSTVKPSPAPNPPASH